LIGLALVNDYSIRSKSTTMTVIAPEIVQSLLGFFPVAGRIEGGTRNRVPFFFVTIDEFFSVGE
jgi:hypothetical protein